MRRKAIEDKKKLNKIYTTFMDAMTKMIDAQSDNYKAKMNRYEKSISMLHTAQNMIHENCAEYTEVQVEIAKNRRLLAINKKHLRGHWRQDAVMVDEINLNKVIPEEGQDRNDQLEAAELGGEVADNIVDYKQEMIRAFLALIGVQKSEDEEEKKEEGPKSIFERLISDVESYRGENVLGTFA